jgi:hypothetical protein
MAVPMIKTCAPGISFSDYQNTEINKSTAVEICFFEKNEHGSFMSLKCFDPSCQKPLIELPKLTSDGLVQPGGIQKYLVCPDSLGYDKLGEPTGRLVSWAHNSTLLNAESVATAQAYKTADRKFYMKPKCQHAFELSVLNRAERLGMSPTVTDLSGENFKWKSFYQVAKQLQDLLKTELFLENDKATVSMAMAMDLALCQIVDKESIRLQTVASSQRREGQYKRFHQKPGVMWTPSIIESFTNGTIKYGAFLTPKKTNFHRFFTQCLHYSCNTWSPIFKHDPRNAALIYSSVCSDLGEKLNKERVLSQVFYSENILPMSYIIANNLQNMLHPQELAGAQWLSEAGCLDDNWTEANLTDFLKSDSSTQHKRKVVEEDSLSEFLVDKKIKHDVPESTDS